MYFACRLSQGGRGCDLHVACKDHDSCMEVGCVADKQSKIS
jgi:hypothetical protein